MKSNLFHSIKKNLPLALLLLISLISLSNSVLIQIPKINMDTKPMPTHNINLDLPVDERYKEILIKYKHNIKAGIAYTAGLSQSAKLLTQFAEYIIRNPSKYDPEWFNYIQAVSKYAEVSLSEAIVLSIDYDLACTSIITQDSQGNISLSRNMDFPTYFIISHSIFQANYYRNGKLLFSGIEMAGFRGILNGLKNNGFAMSINLRRKDRAFYNLIRVFRGYLTPCYFMYKTFLEANNFSEAYQKLKSETISAPVYYTLIGTQKNEGVLLTRDYNMLEIEEKLDVDNGKWFIVITNHDKNQEDPKDDYRRVPAENKLEKIGQQKVSRDNIFENILSQYPNLNLETSYTSLITAQNGGNFNSTVWMP